MHVHIHMSTTALCAFGVTRLINFAFRLLLSDCMSGSLFNQGPPINRPQIRTAESRIPCGPLRKSWFLLQLLPNIYYFAIWIHNIIHTNLMCFFSSNVVFTFPEEASYAAVPSINPQNARAKLLKTKWITIKIDRPGPQNPPPEIMFSAPCFH